MNRINYLSFIILSGFLLIYCYGCVKIETGQTAEEAAQSSEYRAKQIRAEWANRLREADPKETASLLGDHYKRVASIIIDYAYQTAQRWQEGEQGRGKTIEAGEMRQMVDLWLSGEKPVLKAYEDNLEYAYQQLKQSYYFDENFMNRVRELLDMYYKIYSVCLLPQGDIKGYEMEIQSVKIESDELSDLYFKELSEIY